MRVPFGLQIHGMMFDTGILNGIPVQFNPQTRFFRDMDVSLIVERPGIFHGEAEGFFRDKHLVIFTIPDGAGNMQVGDVHGPHRRGVQLTLQAVGFREVGNFLLDYTIGGVEVRGRRVSSQRRAS